VTAEYFVATAMQQVCESLENRIDDAMNSSAYDASDKWEKLISKMIEFDQKLQIEFADQTLDTDIDREIQNYKANGKFDQSMATYVYQFLKRKYGDFAYFAVQLGTTNSGTHHWYDHGIFEATITDKQHAKLKYFDGNTIVVNWALKNESKRLQEHKWAFNTGSWIYDETVKSKTTSEYCDAMLKEVAKTEWFERRKLSFVYVKRFVPTQGPTIADPFFDGDQEIIGCTERYVDCYPSTNILAVWLKADFCYGFF